jgi:hypothetical protein
MQTSTENSATKSASDVDICAITEEVITAVAAGYDIHRLAASRQTTGKHPLDSSYADDTSGQSGSPYSHLNNVAVSIDVANNVDWSFNTEAGGWRRIVMNLVSRLAI